ncbi:MAG: glycosyltransferase [Patescibacteria group bacterium]|nr:glycosyltransferase [Patescibacteria group bacterium]
MKEIFFSIVIPTLNEEKSLPILLNSVKAQDYKKIEIIIVDSFSTDKTKKIALRYKRSLPLFFFERMNQNVSQARNFGARKAKGEFIVFLDADVELGQFNFLSQLNKNIQLNHLDALTVWNRAKENLTGKLIFGLMNLLMTLLQKLRPSANGPCIIVRNSFFKKVGGFDEEIVFGEDVELVQRLVKNKARFAVFSSPILFVSDRRFKKEGLLKSLFKSTKAIFHQLIFGPIKKPIFEYQMGGKYYEN